MESENCLPQLVCCLLLVLQGQGQSALTATPVTKQKPSNLTILVMLPITGDEPRNGESCKVASEIVLNEVNSRSDILPDYHLKAVYRDEGPAATYFPVTTSEFLRQFDKEDQKEENPSPVIVGPFYSNGCMAMAKHTHLLDLVQVAISCSTPQATNNRRIFPNLYRMRVTGEVGAYPVLRFIREVGHWHRFGILADVGQVFDYTVAAFLQKTAVEQGDFEISIFDTVPDFDDQAMGRLKASDSRVIVLEVTIANLVMQFLCQSHKFGLTGSRYVFILHFAAFFEPEKLPYIVGDNKVSCTRDVIWEQLKISYWIAWSMVPSEQSEVAKIVSSLGYDIKKFEEKFVKATRYSKPLDYDKRVLCHDAVLEAVLSLDQAEKQVLRPKNMSLKDYRHNPHEVMLAVNETVAAIDYVGLRIGRFQYSHRLEMDDDILVVVQWTPPNSKRVLYEFHHEGGVAALYNSSSYEMHHMKDPQWFTTDGNPPRDKWRVICSELKISEGFVWFVVAMSFLLTVAQSLSLFKILKDDCLRNLKVVLLFLGCLLLNGAAVLFGTNVTSISMCYAQRILAALGFAFITSYTTSKIQIYRGLMLKLMSSTAPMRNNSTFIRRLNTVRTRSAQARAIASLKWMKRTKVFEVVVVTVLVLAIAHLATWVAVERPDFRLANHTVPEYNEKDDAIIHVTVAMCESDNDSAWIMSAVAFHAILLVASMAIAYHVRKCPTNTDAEKREFNSLFLSVINLFTLLVGTILVVGSLPSPVQHSMTISIFGLLFSGITSALIFRPLLLSELNRVVALLDKMKRTFPCFNRKIQKIGTTLPHNFEVHEL